MAGKRKSFLGALFFLFYLFSPFLDFLVGSLPTCGGADTGFGLLAIIEFVLRLVGSRSSWLKYYRF